MSFITRFEFFRKLPTSPLGEDKCDRCARSQIRDSPKLLVLVDNYYTQVIRHCDAGFSERRWVVSSVYVNCRILSDQHRWRSERIRQFATLLHSIHIQHRDCEAAAAQMCKDSRNLSIHSVDARESLLREI